MGIADKYSHFLLSFQILEKKNILIHTLALKQTCFSDFCKSTVIWFYVGWSMGKASSHLPAKGCIDSSN